MGTLRRWRRCLSHSRADGFRYDSYGIRRAIKTKNPLDALDGFYIDVSAPQLTCSGQIRISVTETPEAGKATEAARAALAKALGVAKTKLTLIRGATARDKLFRLD